MAAGIIMIAAMPKKDIPNILYNKKREKINRYKF